MHKEANRKALLDLCTRKWREGKKKKAIEVCQV